MAGLRSLFWLLGISILAVAIALAAKYSDGHVSIIAAGYRIDLSLNLAVLLGVAFFVGFYLLVRLGVMAWQAPQRAAAWRRAATEADARADLMDSLRGLFSGRFDHAERSARKLADQGGAEPALRDMGATVAAWAAFEAGQPARALPYLRAIDNREAGAMRDASLAYVLLADGKAREALPLLEALHAQDPRNPGVLKMKLEAELAERRWTAVLDTLQRVVKVELMPEAAAQQIAQNAVLEIVKDKASSRDGLLATWRGLERDLRLDPDIASAVTRALIQLGCGQDAAEVVEGTLEVQWDSGLAKLYGDCRADSTLGQIERAEKWLRSQARDPALLLALGKLCMRQGLWGKSQSYLEASVALSPSLEAHMTLAHLMERLGKSAEAVRHIRRSAELAG